MKHSRDLHRLALQLQSQTLIMRKRRRQVCTRLLQSGSLFCQADFEAQKNHCKYWLMNAFQAGVLGGVYNHLAIYLTEKNTDWEWT